MNSFTGLSEKSLTEVQNLLIKVLESKTFYSVFVFGSRSKNTFRQYSDLDLWIESQPALSSKEISALYQSFEESDLPINVDVVTPENCLPEYKEQIFSEQKPWFSSKK